MPSVVSTSSSGPTASATVRIVQDPFPKFGSAEAAEAWSRKLRDIALKLSDHGFDLAADDVHGAADLLAAHAVDDVQVA